MVQQVKVMPEKKRDIVGLIKTIVIIVVSLIAVTFIGLFIWMSVQYGEERDTVDEQVGEAVRTAVAENSLEMEQEFLKREKEPNRDFVGPIDYGEVSFRYPKTWSVYVAKDASNGGDYEAYFNPIEVEMVSKDTINGLRLRILDMAFDDAVAEYQKFLEKKGSELTVESVTVYNTTANRYTGRIPRTDLNGIIVIFKIRDKTAIFQTDSMLFEEDFNKILESVSFNA